MQDLFRIVSLSVVSLALAILINGFHPMGLPIWLNEVKEPAMPVWVWKRLQTTDAQTALCKVSNECGLLVDVRNKEDYQKEHAQDSLNLPYYGFSEHYLGFAKKVAKKEHLFIYCYHSDCNLDTWVAKRLLISGFSNLTIIEEGFEGWKRLNLPTIK
ncbi:MAG: rhodanese-like domain-containing protein [Candidatus Desantisbacteria bacterium]